MVMEKVVKSTSELQYENLINYRVCEIMFIYMKRTKYNTFSSMCSNIRDGVKTKDGVRGELGNLVKLTIRDIKKLYALDQYEAVEVIKHFLDKKLWEQYQSLVMVFVANTPNSFQ